MQPNDENEPAAPAPARDDAPTDGRADGPASTPEREALEELARQVDRRLQALRSKNRAARLKAAHRLGRDLAGAAAPGRPLPPPDAPGPSAEQIRRALAELERLALDANEGAWVRKRARRALRKIRGESEA
ncbi:MAG: hypothetical protein D6776_00550 [Planctomycetota bacterium]|nr:MAG: hypothetical protein D6776_00550 [Planctomycetota bacterium]